MHALALGKAYAVSPCVQVCNSLAPHRRRQQWRTDRDTPKVRPAAAPPHVLFHDDENCATTLVWWDTCFASSLYSSAAIPLTTTIIVKHATKRTCTLLKAQNMQTIQCESSSNMLFLNFCQHSFKLFKNSSDFLFKISSDVLFKISCIRVA